MGVHHRSVQGTKGSSHRDRCFTVHQCRGSTSKPCHTTPRLPTITCTRAALRTANTFRRVLVAHTTTRSIVVTTATVTIEAFLVTTEVNLLVPQVSEEILVLIEIRMGHIIRIFQEIMLIVIPGAVETLTTTTTLL